MTKIQMSFAVSFVFLMSVGGCDFFPKAKTPEAKVQPVELPAENPENFIPRGIASSPESLQRYKEYDNDIKCSSTDVAAGKCRIVSQCSEEIQRKIRNYRVERSWTKMPGGQDGSSSYFSPTTEVGKWARVRKYQSGAIQFSILRANKTEMWNFSTTCSATHSERARAFVELKPRPGLEDFTDKDLWELLEKTANFGVIYVWSPGMSYSFERNSDPNGAYKQLDDSGLATTGIKNAHDAMIAVGQKLGVTVRLTVLVDPSARKEQVDRVFRAGNHDLTDKMLRRMTAFDLLLRQMGQHYPSILVYGNGKVYRLMQPGLSTTESYRQFIEGAVLALQKN